MSKDIFENPIRFEFLRESYRPLSLGTAFGLSVVITALPTLLDMVAPAVIDSSFAKGFDAGLDGVSGVMVWSLCLAQLPAMLLSSYYLGRGKAKRRAFYRTYWLQSLLQFTWLQLLAFYTVPLFPLIGVAMLFGLFFGWVFNDCLGMYDSPRIKRQYLLAFPLFDLILLGIDAAGGRGLIHAFETNPQYFFNVLALQIALIMLTQAIITVIGRHIYDHDQRQVEQTAMLQEMASIHTERSVLEATWGIMANGLVASKFAHDLKNTLMILLGSVDGLKKELGSPGGGRSRRVLAPNWTLLDACQEDLEWASRHIAEMVERYARTVQEEKPCVLTDVGALVQQATQQTRAALHQSEDPSTEIRAELEAAQVYVTDSHSSLLSNLLTNGIQQRPGQPVDISGVRVNEWFYLLRVRDYGVSEAARPQAIRNVLKALTIEKDRRVERDHQYRGYGMALLLAKILLVRHNGWLGVTVPERGPGLEMNVILPTCPKDQIPKELNKPELVIELVGYEVLTLSEIPSLHPESPAV